MNLSRAYATVLQAGSADINATLAFMKKKGHLSLLPSIARILERETRPEVTVSLSKAEDAKKYSSQIASALKEIGATEYSIVIDPHQVGGYAVRGKSKAIDRSYRKALVSIYQRVTE